MVITVYIVHVQLQVYTYMCTNSISPNCCSINCEIHCKQSGHVRNRKRRFEVNSVFLHTHDLCVLTATVQTLYTVCPALDDSDTLSSPHTQGEKIFYLIPPTEENLIRYEQWVMSANQSEVFFGDLVPKCYICRVRQGNTLFIPSGE